MLGWACWVGALRVHWQVWFEVSGYSQNPRNIPGVRCLHAGEASLAEFVRQVNLLICLLPRTAATEGILNYELFRRLPQGSFLINAARGAHLDEDVYAAYL